MLSRLQQLTSFLLVLLFASLCTVSQSALGASVATLYADSSQEEQAAPTTLEGLTAEERQELLSRLTDAQVRELVLEMLAQDAAAEQTDPGMIGGFHENIRAFRSEFTEVLSAWPRLSEVIPFFFNQLIPYGKDATTILWVILSCLGIFTIAWLVERFYLRLVQGLETRLLSAEPETFTDKFKFLSLRLVLRLIGLGIFALTSVAALFVIDPESKSIRLTVLTYIFGVVCFRLISQISRFLLAPATSSHRLIPLESPNAKQIHRWILWLGGYASFVILTANHIEDLGLDASLSRLVHFLDGAVYVVLIIVATWQIRKPIRGVLRGSNEQDSVFGSARNVFADLWHVFFTIALLIIYAEAQYIRMMGYELATSAAFGTLIMLIAFPLIGVAAQQIIADSARRRIRAKLVEKDESEELAQRLASASSFGRPIIVLGLAVAAVFLLGWLWGVDLFAMGQDTLGGKVFDGAVEILAALILAYVVWILIARAMEPYMPRDTASGPGDEGGGTGASRISTLMPLMKKFLLVTLVTITVMVALSALGVNIGPLIAGAGVVGIALGFGAQSLVRDVLSGLFFLMDDAFRKGEYIESDNIRGTVERISIRSFQLRHHNGPVHTIPYGEIKSVTNYSRDWAIMKFDLRIPFETDVDKVRKIIKKTGQKMMDDEVLGPLMMEPLKSQGVNRMDDSALIVRCKFTARPGQQFYIRREAYTRIQKAFEENGIHFAPRRVIVEGAPSPTAAAAAAGTLDNPAEQANAPKAADDRG